MAFNVTALIKRSITPTTVINSTTLTKTISLSFSYSSILRQNRIKSSIVRSTVVGRYCSSLSLPIMGTLQLPATTNTKTIINNNNNNTKHQIRRWITTTPTIENNNFNSNSNTNTSNVATTIEQNQTNNNNDNILKQQYETMVQNDMIQKDRHQLNVMNELDRVRNDIFASYDSYSVVMDDDNKNNNNDNNDNDKSNNSLLNSLLFQIHKVTPTNIMTSFLNPTKNNDDDNNNDSTNTSNSNYSKNVKGTYVHGGVGCGKTFAMDMFYDSLDNESLFDLMNTNSTTTKSQTKQETKRKWSKQKVHFHKFMLDVHQQMHEAKMIEGIEGDVLPRVIEKIIDNGKIICFDEFQVTDVADALILGRLFTGLLRNGAVLIITSNRPPKDLYLNGIQRDRFIPFIHLLEKRTNEISMWESEVDYRKIQGKTKSPNLYFVGPSSKTAYEEAYLQLTNNSTTRSTIVYDITGRTIPIPSASIEHSVARFTFHDLCRTNRGAADYVAIVQQFHTIFIENIPLLDRNDFNAVRRFIVLIDSAYEGRVRLIVHAASIPGELYQVDLGNKHSDEAFAFDRTRSRLEEMGSDDYLRRRWIGNNENQEKSGGGDDVAGGGDVEKVMCN